MRVREWAKREGFNEQTVWQWCRENRMPVPFERMSTGTIIIHDPKYENRPVTPTANGRTVCYARVSSSDQKDDLTRQADRLKAFALGMGVEKPEIVTETGSGMNDRRRKLNRLLSDPTVDTLIAQGRRIIVVDDTELDDDLVRDMTEVLTSFCARLYGRRAAKRKTDAALKAARDA